MKVLSVTKTFQFILDVFVFLAHTAHFFATLYCLSPKNFVECITPFIYYKSPFFVISINSFYELYTQVN